jgi:hypothetical protein
LKTAGILMRLPWQITEDFSFNCSVLFIDKEINPLVAFIRKSILFEYNPFPEDIYYHLMLRTFFECEDAILQ